ncbi:MAG: DUF1573 domain-containing protein [Gemmataceae bacterium]|nr:DUF1573 domain-containing protein [Gemmataceae bacterium]
MKADETNQLEPVVVRPSVWSRTWPILLLGTIAAAAFWLSERSKHRPTVLVVDAKELNFGETWETKDFHWKIKITNVSEKALKIREFGASCACVVCEPKSLSLAPAESAEVKLNLDLRQAFVKKSSEAENAVFETEVAAFVEGMHPPPIWRLKGTVRRALRFEKYPLEIKDNLTRGRDFPLQLIHAKAHPTLVNAKWKVICPPEYGTAALLATSKLQGTVQATLSISPKIAVGKFSCDVVFETDEGEPIACALPVLGNVSETVSLLPSTLVYGAAPLGARKSQHVSVQGPGKVKVQRIEWANKDIEVVSTERENIYQVRVLFANRGQQESNVRFYLHSEGEKRDLELLLMVSYYGT